jgi:hypothetical protein
LLLTIGERDSAKSGEFLKMARHIAAPFGPHVKAFVVGPNAAASESVADCWSIRRGRRIRGLAAARVRRFALSAPTATLAFG